MLITEPGPVILETKVYSHFENYLYNEGLVRGNNSKLKYINFCNFVTCAFLDMRKNVFVSRHTNFALNLPPFAENKGVSKSVSAS